MLCLAGLAFTGGASAQEEGGQGKEEFKKKSDELKAKQRELYKGLSTHKKEVMKDPEITELKKALDEKINEKLAAIPEAKKLLDEMETLKKQMNELKPPKQPRKEKPKAEGEGKRNKKEPKGKKPKANSDDAMDN